MAITIQELLASDTVSQATDKINFNFDQILLNGGGVPGPQGQPGPQGPIGGRGLRGSKWYEDPNSTATNPNTLIFADVEIEDNYLDADGDVWTYNGTAWVQTAVGLQGPQGAPGVSAGFDYFGFPLLTGEQSIYATVMPTGTAAGASAANEGIPTVVLGAVPSTATPVSGIPFTSAYKLGDTLAQNIESDVTAVLIHQKDTSASAIKFAGGGEIASEKLEQIDINNLTNIALGLDDRLVITVPKIPTTPSVASDLIGYELNTLFKSQSFYAGKAISMSTGNDSTVRLASEISDFTITVNTSNSSIPGKFNVRSTATASTALFEVGGNITLPSSTTRTGRILLDAGNIWSVAKTANQMRGQFITVFGSSEANVISNDIRILADGASAGGAEALQLMSDNGIRIESGTGDIIIETTDEVNVNADLININADNNVFINAAQAELYGTDEVSIFTDGGGSIRLSKASISGADAEIKLNYDTISYTGIRGRLAWRLDSNPVGSTGTAFWELDATLAGAAEPMIRVVNNSSIVAVGFRTQSQGSHFTDVKPVGIHSYGAGLGNDYFKVDQTQVSSGKPVNYKKSEYTWNPAGGLVPNWGSITSSFATWKVGPFGQASTATGSSSFNQTVVLPDGTYDGQRLTVRLINMPFSYALFGGGTAYFSGSFRIAGRAYLSGSNTILVGSVSNISGTNYMQDVVAELVWMDGETSVTTVDDVSLYTFTVFGGWRVLSTKTEQISGTV